MIAKTYQKMNRHTGSLNLYLHQYLSLKRGMWLHCCSIKLYLTWFIFRQLANIKHLTILFSLMSQSKTAVTNSIHYQLKKYHLHLIFQPQQGRIYLNLDSSCHLNTCKTNKMWWMIFQILLAKILSMFCLLKNHFPRYHLQITEMFQ